MGSFIDIPVGTIFGSRTVISEAFKKVVGKGDCYFYLCRCVCGEEKDVRKSQLLNKKISSCQNGRCNYNFIDGN